jgi:hypothetical protein
MVKNPIKQKELSFYVDGLRSAAQQAAHCKEGYNPIDYSGFIRLLLESADIIDEFSRGGKA